MSSTSPRLWRIGLTGGIGSGKSTVAGMLAECGAAVIDADAISRSLTAAGGRAMPEIARQFGQGMVDAQGAMDRQAMRAQVFADPQARQRLEAIIHPLVAQISEEQVQAALAAGVRCLVHDVPLLVEAGARWRSRVDRVLVVDCPESLQVERVMRRNHLSHGQVEAIMASQASRAQRLAAATDVIVNDADTDALERQVARMHETYLELAGAGQGRAGGKD